MKLSAGIEISEQYLKIALARRQGLQTKLFDLVVEPLPSLRNEAITAAISELFKKNKYKPKSVSITLPRNFITVRNIHFPSQDEAEIAKMIELHIGRITPYKKDEVAFSYYLAGVDEMGYARVVLAIAHNDIIKKPIRIIEEAGLSVDRIVLSSDSIAQSILRYYGSQINQKNIYLILDIDTTFTDFIILNRSGVLFTRSISIKTEEINQEIGLKKLLGEIRQSLLIFNNEEINQRPERIFLTGLASEQVKAVIEKEMNIAVTEASQVREMLRAKKQNLPGNVSVSGVCASVLETSSQKLIFSVPEIQIRKTMRERTRDLIVLGSLLVYLLTIIGFIIMSRNDSQSNYLKMLEERSAAIEKDLGDIVNQLDKIKFIKRYIQERRIPLYVVYQLQKIITPDIALNYISVDEGNKITLRGQATQAADVFGLTSELGKISNFKEAQTRYTRKRKTKEKEFTDFEINFLLNL